MAPTTQAHAPSRAQLLVHLALGALLELSATRCTVSLSMTLYAWLSVRRTWVANGDGNRPNLAAVLSTIVVHEGITFEKSDGE
jgi:hypothetical protein